jgi:hypothetical protein
VHSKTAKHQAVLPLNGSAPLNVRLVFSFGSAQYSMAKFMYDCWRSNLVVSTDSTMAFGGPREHHRIIPSTSFLFPSTNASTLPSSLFRTQPLISKPSATYFIDDLKKTPWTLPEIIAFKHTCSASSDSFFLGNFLGHHNQISQDP